MDVTLDEGEGLFGRGAIQLGDAVLDSRRGKLGRFRPGQPLTAANDEFVREFIEPVVPNYVSQAEEYLIVIFNIINLVFVATALEFFLWIGLADLLLYYLPWPSPSTEDGVVLNATIINSTLITSSFPLINLTSDFFNNTFSNDTEADEETTINVLSNGVYYAIGVVLYFLSVRFVSMDKSYDEMVVEWTKGVPNDLGWVRKVKSYGRALMNFIAYVLLITGSWNLFEVALEDSISRDCGYLFGGILMTLIFSEFLSPESLYWLSAHLNRKMADKQQKEPASDKQTLRELEINGSDSNSIEYDVFLDYPKTGFSGLFKPGQPLPWVRDSFAREVIHPIVQPFVSPGEVYLIDFFNYFNAILILPLLDTLQWVGLWDLIMYHISWNDPVAEAGAYMGVGFFLLFVGFRFFNPDDGSIDLGDSWHLRLSESFGWRRKLKSFGRSTFAFVGCVIVWVGGSVKWDMDQEQVGTYGWYVGAPFALMFVFGELLSMDALFYLVVFWTKVLRRTKGEPEEGYELYEDSKRKDK